MSLHLCGWGKRVSSLRPSWATQWVDDQPNLYMKTLKNKHHKKDTDIAQ